MIVLIFTAVSLVNSVILQCTFQNINWLEIGTQYSCGNVKIISDGNLTHVIGVAGNHTIGKSDADVKAFHIQSSHEHLNRIPKGINKFFPNLIYLGWMEGNLTILSADDLEPFPGLKILWLRSNELVSLDGDLFKHTPKLLLINLSLNRLKHVGFGLFDGFSNNSTGAIFHLNPCFDYITPGYTLEKLKLILHNQCPPLETTTASAAAVEASTASGLSADKSEISTKTGTSTDSGQGSIQCFGLIKKLIYFVLFMYNF